MGEQNVYPDLDQHREMLQLAFERAGEQACREFEALPDRWRHPELEPGREHLIEMETQFGDLPAWESIRKENLTETEQLLLRRLWQQMLEERRFPDKWVAQTESEASSQMVAWVPEAIQMVREEAKHQPREVDIASIWAE